MRLNLDIDPHSIMMDFELALKQNTEQVFPHADIKGGFFLLSESIFHLIQRHCLQTRYQQDDYFAMETRHIGAIVFVPRNNVEDAST